MAIEKGIKAGDEFSLSTRTVFKWLLNFENNERLKINKQIIDSKKQIPPMEKKELTEKGKIDFVNSTFNNWKNGKQTLLVPCYEICKQEGWIIVTREQGQQMVKNVIVSLREEYKIKSSRGNTLRSTYLTRIEQINKVMPSDYITIPSFVIAECQRVTIVNWFNENKNLDQILK